MDILDKAIVFATEKHSGYYRKETNIPYIVHPLEACCIASSLTNDKEVMAASVLHDTIEDTNTTESELRELFGDKIANLVMSDTENKRIEIPAKDSWQIRKQETLDYLLKSSLEEQIICIADKLSNIRAIYRDYQRIGDKLWDRFNVNDKNKHYWYYSEVAKRLNLIKNTDAYKEYEFLINKIFNKGE